MEKAKNVYTLCADFGWSDLGTWKSLYENCSKNDSNNVINNRDNIITDNTYNSIIHLPKGKTAVINDLEDFIIVDSGDSLLITKFENEQNIKENVNELKRRKEVLISHS
jgi:mannose-1-phosphate guanylyltransferase